jgi:hypothetical protein
LTLLGLCGSLSRLAYRYVTQLARWRVERLEGKVL